MTLYTGHALTDTPASLTLWERITIAAVVVAYLLIGD